uniref:phage major tail tube protein n=1 Tax=Aliarcobacter sp. TaxID=2321116 RepID=UPI0040477A8D
MDRSVIVGINVFVGGMGNIGVAESFKTPAIKQKKLTQNTAVGEKSVSWGALESLDTEVNFKALPSSLYSELAKNDGAELIFKKSIITGGETSSMEWVCTGAIDLEYGESKEGEFLDVKISQKGLKKYVHEVNGKVLVNVDHENLICSIDGNDMLADTRAAILS